MSDPVEATTTRVLALALQAASLRQQVASANVAQAGTAGWQALAVDFEAQLSLARHDHLSRGRVDAGSLQGVQPRVMADPAPAGALDAELARMSAHAIHAQALIQGLSRHLGLLSQAAADGRR